MVTEVCIGIDIGSTNTKILALDSSGAVVARRAFSTPRVQDGSIRPGRLVDTLENELLALCWGKFSVVAIATGGVGEDGFLLGGALNPLGDAMSWFDSRRKTIDQKFLDSLASDGVESGVQLDSARTLVGWAWIAKNDPDDLVRAHYWAQVTDFPLIAWTHRAVITDNLASRSAAWNPWTRKWINPRVEATLGNLDLLPEVVASGDVVGPIVSETLTPILAPGAVGVSAGHDHPVGGWLVSEYSPGSVLDSMGTAEVITAQQWLDTSPENPEINVSPGILSDKKTVLYVNELARNFEWLQRKGPGFRDALTRVLNGTGEVDISASEVFVVGGQGGKDPSWTAGADGLGDDDLASVALRDLARVPVAIAEAMATSSASTPSVFASGGWTRSPGWMRLKQQAFQLPFVAIPEDEVTACAAATIAAHAMGWSPDASTTLGFSEPGS